MAAAAGGRTSTADAFASCSCRHAPRPCRHGDEALPYNFFVDNRGCPGWGPRLQGLQAAFSQAFVDASPDFQTERG